MKRRELDKLIAEKLIGLEPCRMWRPVWYADMGAALVRDTGLCPHQDGKCYSITELVTLLGVMGGVPQYSMSSRAGLVLLAELKKRCGCVQVIGNGGTWFVHLYKWMETGKSEIIASGEASSVELAISLSAADLAGVKLTAGDIDD